MKMRKKLYSINCVVILMSLMLCMTACENTHNNPSDNKVTESDTVSDELPVDDYAEEETMSIDEILKIEDGGEMMSELSYSIGEKCEFGESIDVLNEAEKKVFYIDEVVSEVGSDGFEGYLYYYGDHFEETLKCADELKLKKLSTLMNKVKSVFPDNKIPEDIESIQDMLDEEEYDFDEFDEMMYDGLDYEIENELARFVKENIDQFK